MFDLFGSEMPLPAKFFIAFATVLALIGLTAWLVRRFGANRLGGANARGRQPRLAVIDAATVDGRRRLVLIRRDNVEHLLMIGGPTDLVVEPNIVRAAANRDPTREPPRAEMPRTEPALRQPPPVENAWPLQPVSEPPSVPTQRPYRVSATEEPWLAPEPGARPRPADSSLGGLAAEMTPRVNPTEPSAIRGEAQARKEPPVRQNVPPPVMPPEPVAPQQTDHNLAEMAQQLEAALRRTAIPEGRPPVTDPLAAQTAQPKTADATARAPAPARDYKLRVDPQFETKAEPKVRPEMKPEPKFETKLEPKFEVPPEPKLEDKPKPADAAGKTVYDSLEEEMASLLGRPPGKT